MPEMLMTVGGVAGSCGGNVRYCPPWLGTLIADAAPYAINENPKNSSMIEVARAFNAHVHKIEKVDDLRLEWLRGKEKVGIIGANETPEWMIDEAIERIKSMAA